MLYHPAALRDLRAAMLDARKPLWALKERLLEEAKDGGVAQVQRTFAHHWNHYVVVPRRCQFICVAKQAAARRVESIVNETKERYGIPYAVTTRSVQLAVHHALTRGRRAGHRVWRLTDPCWPSDAYIYRRFLTTLDDWSRRSQAKALRLEAAAGSSSFDEPTAEDVVDRVMRGKAPRMDPTFKKIAYPFGPETADPLELVESATDQVVVGRGEYYAVAGIRDLAHEVDHLVAQLESKRVPQIIGWRWVLSPAHTPAVCPPRKGQDEGICDALAEADVGHPSGPGCYFDAAIPNSHPNCWCSIDEIWTDEDTSDPAWEAPEPDAGYEARVRELVESHGVEWLAEAA